MNDWSPMTNAPRDGTVVELRCTYGDPWTDLYRWKRAENEVLLTNGDLVPANPRWCNLRDESRTISDEKYFQWRSPPQP